MSTPDHETDTSDRTVQPEVESAVRSFLFRVGFPHPDDDATEHVDPDAPEHPVPAAAAAAQRIEELERENAELRAQLEDIERLAKTALGAARAVDDGRRGDGGPSKKQRAQLLSRDEAVRRAVDSSGKGGSVTVGQVEDMALPETQLRWQTVRDAWDALVSSWRIFRIDEDNEPTRLVVDREDLRDHDDLVGVVAESLGRDDLAKRLVGGSEGKGN
jgi:hypothetical protein